MDWTRDPDGGYTLAVPDAAETWPGLRPYFAALWARVLADLPALGLPAKPAPALSLLIDGRQGGGHVWLLVPGWGKLPAVAANPALATAAHLTVPGVEVLVSGADDYEAAICTLADEVLAAAADEPAARAARAALAAHPKLTVRHDAVDPEHGWYKPFKAKVADLVAGKRPRVRWTFDFEEE